MATQTKPSISSSFSHTVGTLITAAGTDDRVAALDVIRTAALPVR